MCMHGVLIQNGKCDKDKECRTKNCAFCTYSNRREVCTMCSGEYMLEDHNGTAECVKEQRRS